jgi:DNA-binding NarL/FixJ family response regulator
MTPQRIVESRKQRVLVAEDHPVVRHAVAQLINQQADLVSCGTAESVCELSAAVRAEHPDLLLLDLGLKDGNALPHIPALHEEFPALRILVLSQYDENLYAEPALQGGARGYIMKEVASEEVLNAIRSVLRGETYLSPKLSARLPNKYVGIKSPAIIPALEHLSPRELEILQLLGAGLGTREVAEQLGLSIKTVETYREKLKAKLELNTGEELLRWASLWVEGKLATLETPTGASLPSSQTNFQSCHGGQRCERGN